MIVEGDSYNPAITFRLPASPIKVQLLGLSHPLTASTISERKRKRLQYDSSMSNALRYVLISITMLILLTTLADNNQ